MMPTLYYEPSSNKNSIPIKTIHPKSLLNIHENRNKYQSKKETKKMKKSNKNSLFHNIKTSSKNSAPCKLSQKPEKTTLICKSSSFFFNNDHFTKTSKNTEDCKMLSISASAVSMAGYEPVPPIPPRMPLKRSLSLTHHPKPPPYEARSSNRSSRQIPLSFHTHVPFIVDPLNPRRPATTLARSAPTLSTINTGNHLLLFSKTSRGNQKIITALLSNQERRHHQQQQHSHLANLSYNENHQNIISLARWPLANQQRNNHQLAIDSLAGKASVTPNEYIESPKMYSKSVKVNKKLISNLTRNNTSANNSFNSRSNITSFTNNSNNHVNNDTRLLTNLTNIHQSTCFVPVPTVSNQEKQSNFFLKLKNLMSTKKTSKCDKLINHKYSLESSNECNHLITWPLTQQPPSLPLPTSTITHSYQKQNIQECKTSIMCRHCGKCRCRDCSKRKEGNNGSSMVECLSCMCLIKPVFYHCLKDQDSEDDCSDKPCACCSQPNCLSRWSIMALLLPCLPCLACYLPLKLLFSLCCPSRHHAGCTCNLHSSNSSSFKILLESEVSST